MSMEKFISATEAAKEKGCSRQAVDHAIRTGKLTMVGSGKVRPIVIDEKFEAWRPSPKRQEAGSMNVLKRLDDS